MAIFPEGAFHNYRAGRQWTLLNIMKIASGSLDLVDLHGIGGLAGAIRDQSRGRGSISYNPIPLARPKS